MYFIYNNKLVARYYNAPCNNRYGNDLLNEEKIIFLYYIFMYTIMNLVGIKLYNCGYVNNLLK